MADRVVDLDEIIEIEVIVPEIKAKPAVVDPPALVRPPVVPKGIAVSDVEEVIEHAESYFGSDLKGLLPLQQLVLVGYLKTCNASLACALAGASIAQHRRWLKDSEPYREIFAAAQEAIADKVEATAVVEAVTKKDPRLLMGLLKGLKREKYGQAKGLGDKDEQPTSWADLARKMAE